MWYVGGAGGTYTTSNTAATASSLYASAVGGWLNGGVGQTTSTTGWNSNTTFTQWTTAAGTGSTMGLATWTDTDGQSAQAALWQAEVMRTYLRGQQLQLSDPEAYRRHQEAVRRAHEEQRQREAEANRQFEERAKLRKEAAERAQELLLVHLTPEQRESVVKNKWFVVEGGKSKKKYRIKTTAAAGNVLELDPEGRVVASYCCHADHSFPMGDQHLTQKLMLECDEDAFLRVANRTGR